jgi:hypothetical protein
VDCWVGWDEGGESVGDDLGDGALRYESMDVLDKIEGRKYLVIVDKDNNDCVSCNFFNGVQIA